jgi:multiple sugar transport system permease protein
MPAVRKTMTVDRRGWRVRLLTLWLPLAVAMFFALFPFYWMAITSLKTNQELYSRKVMPLIVHNPTLKHYVDLLTETSFLEWTWNTLLVAVISTAISLVLGAMLAYPLARLRFAGAAMVSFAIAAT